MEVDGEKAPEDLNESNDELITVEGADGSKKEFSYGKVDALTTHNVLFEEGKILKITVSIPSNLLVP